MIRIPIRFAYLVGLAFTNLVVLAVELPNQQAPNQQET
jgi:hypothetical protein